MSQSKDATCSKTLFISVLVLSLCLFAVRDVSCGPQNAEEVGFESVAGEGGVPGEEGEGELPEEEETTVDPVKMMEMVKENMTAELSEATGKDWGDLSSAILGAAWLHNGNKTEISVLQLMEWFDNVGGEERLHLLRILELMDKNMDGMISKEEFISLYAAPMASPDKAIELLHRVLDYDGNGQITIWESLLKELTVDGINRNIYDKYHQSAFDLHKMDANLDRRANLHEFTNYMVWQINKGIHKTVKPVPLAADADVLITIGPAITEIPIPPPTSG